jgi:hypothetical protein
VEAYLRVHLSAAEAHHTVVKDQPGDVEPQSLVAEANPIDVWVLTWLNWRLRMAQWSVLWSKNHTSPSLS